MNIIYGFAKSDVVLECQLSFGARVVIPKADIMIQHIPHDPSRDFFCASSTDCTQMSDLLKVKITKNFSIHFTPLFYKHVQDTVSILA